MQVHVSLSLAAFIDYNETLSHTKTFQLLAVQVYHPSLLPLTVSWRTVGSVGESFGRTTIPVLDCTYHMALVSSTDTWRQTSSKYTHMLPGQNLLMKFYPNPNPEIDICLYCFSLYRRDKLCRQSTMLGISNGTSLNIP
jgi:hypothetical protein